MLTGRELVRFFAFFGLFRFFLLLIFIGSLLFCVDYFLGCWPLGWEQDDVRIWDGAGEGILKQGSCHGLCLPVLTDSLPRRCVPGGKVHRRRKKEGIITKTSKPSCEIRYN